MRVLIAGCGYVGSVLAERLRARGDTVIGLTRTTRVLPAGVQPLVADLTGKLRRLPDTDVVVFAAAPAASDDETYRRTYVDGLRAVLEASVARRVVLCSSTAVYGQSDGSWVDEAAATRPRGFAGARLLEAEALLGGAGREGVIVRFGGIYGPGRTRLIDAVREGTAVRHGEPPEYTNRIHRDDCAGALEHLLRLRAPARVYNAVDEAPAPRDEVLCWLAEQLGLPPPPLGARPPSPRGDSNKRVAGKRLVASGYRFLYPTYREGYAELF